MNVNSCDLYNNTWGRYCDYPHFVNEGLQDRLNLPKVTQLVSDSLRILTR